MIFYVTIKLINELLNSDNVILNKLGIPIDAVNYYKEFDQNELATLFLIGNFKVKGNKIIFKL